MTMLEKAARAQCIAGGLNPDQMVTYNDGKSIEVIAQWAAHLPLVRAVLSAIRESDDDTFRRAWPKEWRGPYTDGLGIWDLREAHWRLVDAILSEEPK